MSKSGMSRREFLTRTSIGLACHILEHEDIGMMGMWHLMPMDAGACTEPMPR